MNRTTARMKISSVLTLGLAVSAVGCTEVSGAADTAPEWPALHVVNQTLSTTDEVTIERIDAPIDAWLMIYDDADGAPGALLAGLGVPPGSYDGLGIDLPRAIADGETLWARLHVDGGRVGVWEWPGADGVLTDASGSPIETAFVATHPDTPGADGTDDPDGVWSDPYGDGAGTGTTTPADTPTTSASCATYCAAVTTACTGTWAQYDDVSDCLAHCGSRADLPVGQDASWANTIACREHQATLATDAPADHCHAAGPGGGGVCGSWCDNYCHLALTRCTGTSLLYGDEATCQTTCADFEDGGASCRFDQLLGTDPHCAWASSYPVGPCADPTDPGNDDPGNDDPGNDDLDPGNDDADPGNDDPAPGNDDPAPGDDDPIVVPPTSCGAYCETVMTACAGSNTQFDSWATCLATCETWPQGTPGETTGNTLACRQWHANAASVDGQPSLSCTAAGPTGGATCGSWCDAYCALHDATCTGFFAQFADSDDCTTRCTQWSVGGSVTDTVGDSLQCRTQQLTLALDPEGFGPEVYCPHAGDLSGDCSGDIPAHPECSDYCTLVMGSCSGENAQYTSYGQCLGYCLDQAQLPVGVSGQTWANSVGCRSQHALLAAEQDPALHCPHAGPSGGGLCGSWCDNYCHLAQTNCHGDDAIYATDDACIAACSGIAEDGLPGDTSGNTIQCRIHHLGLAGNPAAGGPTVHCPHGSSTGGGVCGEAGPTCLEYCDTVTAACTGDAAQYPSHADCMSYCGDYGQLPVGALTDTKANSIGCRTWHAEVAGNLDPEIHCHHAGPSGGNVCGSWCDNYCHLAMANCQGNWALYDTWDTCLSSCDAFDDLAPPGDPSGDTVQCRLHHLGLAGDPNAGGPAAHCPHAAPDGGGVCADAGPSCGEYCGIVTDSCQGANAQFSSTTECLDLCAALPLGAETDTKANSVGCRTWHATVAGQVDPDIHCHHAGASGGDVCGTLCESYCHLAMTSCTGNWALYPSWDACVATCGSLPTDGAWKDLGGDSVQCRINHLVKASSPDAGGPAVHCAHAGADGGGVCSSDAPPVEEPLVDPGTGHDWLADVQPILGAKCGGCHTSGASGGLNFASPPIGLDDASQVGSCFGLTKAECSLVRITNGSMPKGKGCGGVVPDGSALAGSCITQTEFAILEDWEDAGFLH